MNENRITGFVILHYNEPEITKNCIHSILQLDGNEQVRIVVVDNHSPDGSGQLLKKQCTDPRVQVLLLEDNIGFSRANNIGYEALRAAYPSDTMDFIVITNNDTEFKQKNFITELHAAYQREPFYVAGPDIWAIHQKLHQSPMRQNLKTHEDVCAEIRLQRRRLLLAPVETVLRGIYLRVNETALYRKYKGTRESLGLGYIPKDKNWTLPQENVVLQGACLIFSDQFIAQNEPPFSPVTDFYYEEDILALRCRRNGWRMAYLPQLQVTHLEGAGTQRNNYYKRITFRYRNLLRAGKIYKAYLEGVGDRKVSGTIKKV